MENKKTILTLSASAKLNLTLEITGRREDGYHQLRSVMQSVSLYNTLRIETSTEFSSGLSLSCNDPLLPLDERNTAMKAAALFFSASGIKGSARLTLKKVIPYQAGLGSASSDGAAALYGLNLLYGSPFNAVELNALGAVVGADVPFALVGGTRLAQGVGEELTQLPSLPPCSIVLVCPSEGISTLDAYRRYDALKAPDTPDNAGMLAGLYAGSLAAVGGCCKNVFQQVCTELATEDIVRLLLGYKAVGAALTGSGSAVFGLFADEGAAKAACLAAKDYGRCFVVAPTDKSLIIE